MKRFLTLLMALCLLLGLSGCKFISSTITRTENVSADSGLLYDQGLELAGMLEEILSSGEYMLMMSGSQEINDVIMPYMRSDLSEPESVYMITPSEDMIPILMGMEEVDLDSFSAPLREFLEHRVLSSLPTMLNSQGGSSVLAAASICNVSNVWAGETLDEDCYLLYFYPTPAR